MTLEDILTEYRTLASQANECHSRALENSLNWAVHLNGCIVQSELTTSRLRQVKEELRVYRAVLHNKELVD
jgi:hypothetical protein